MCGRYALAAPRSQLASRFALDHCDDYPLRYNIAPGSEIAAVRLSPTGQRVLHLLRWGLLPHWASEPAIGARLINARAESLRARPSFRQSFQRRRCLIPAGGFYEWQAATASARQPWYCSLQSGEPMAMFCSIIARRLRTRGLLDPVRPPTAL